MAYFLLDTVDALDLKAFYEPYEGDGRRNSPYDPRISTTSVQLLTPP